MLLACALVILLTVGFDLPVMLDITMTPDYEFTVLSKSTWLMVAGAFWIFGATAWLIVGRPHRLGVRHRPARYGDGFGPAEALLRHPATQAAGGYAEMGNWLAERHLTGPVGPDDDEEFLAELERRIRDSREDS